MGDERGIGNRAKSPKAQPTAQGILGDSEERRKAKVLDVCLVSSRRANASSCAINGTASAHFLLPYEYLR